MIQKVRQWQKTKTPKTEPKQKKTEGQKTEMVAGLNFFLQF